MAVAPSAISLAEEVALVILHNCGLEQVNDPVGMVNRSE